MGLAGGDGDVASIKKNPEMLTCTVCVFYVFHTQFL
jgi:hypothetical protein